VAWSEENVVERERDTRAEGAHPVLTHDWGAI